MLYLSDFLDLVEDGTFMSVRWKHNLIYHYRGLRENFFDYDDDLVVVQISDTVNDGLIIVIDTENI